MLFWDKRETAKELSKQFNSHIEVLYVDETTNRHSYVVENMKHSLGLAHLLFNCRQQTNNEY